MFYFFIEILFVYFSMFELPGAVITSCGNVGKIHIFPSFSPIMRLEKQITKSLFLLIIVGGIGANHVLLGVKA